MFISTSVGEKKTLIVTGSDTNLICEKMMPKDKNLKRLN